MTSEEPITHLEWFTDLLQQAGVRPAEHLLVMTLPDSYLDRFANAQQAPSLPLQPDGGDRWTDERPHNTCVSATYSSLSDDSFPRRVRSTPLGAATRLGRV